MATAIAFKNIIDQPLWRPEAPIIASSSSGACMAGDLRNDATRHPLLFWLRSNTALDVFNPLNGSWMPLASPALLNSLAAGAACVFHPSQGPRGILASGSTNTVINITTALPASVGINQLANRGDGVGFRIRIIGNGTASSGKINERTIIANTGGTTPVITLDTALDFTPASNDAYEIISGRLFMLSAGLIGAGIWKWYDVATNSFNATALASASLPATIGTDSALVALSELHTPNTQSPGAGMLAGTGTYNASYAPLSCIIGTAATATTIVGSGLPALFVNEYTNFQVRIVQDTVNMTAVGQRRRISSHTSGVAPVFTVASFAVTPSSSAQFVIENDDDKILLRSSVTTLIYNYNITGNTWDTTTWAVPVANGAGSCAAQAFGITRDTSGNARHSMIHFIRGGASTAIDVFDIAAAATGSWSNAIVYGGLGQTFSTGTSGAYDPATMNGQFLYININGTQFFTRYDLRNRFMEQFSYLRFSQGTAVVGGKMASALFVDGSTKLTFVYAVGNTLQPMFSVAVSR